MAAASGVLIPPTDNPVLERLLRAKLEQRRGIGGSFGALESIALRLGLIQNAESPSFPSARIIVFAADHGLAVDDIGGPSPRSTATTVLALLNESLPLAAFARLHGLELTIVDSGIAESLKPDARLLARKIAHGTRNSRAGVAMSTEQAHAAIRAGMEIGHKLGGSAVACAGIGIGATESAALLLSCMSGAPLRELIDTRPSVAEALRTHLLRVLEDARNRHGHREDPVELLAAVGGFEVAMMAGLMLAAASRRRLVIVDGLAACAALLVASEIAPAVPDYCVYVRSNPLPAFANALALFGNPVPLEFGFDALDGTGATLAWPLLRSAAALLLDPPRSREGALPQAATEPRERVPLSQR
jgi:nicotinate-nucleotide--dimethylbenzimidazole phosphoribosyltransferase